MELNKTIISYNSITAVVFQWLAETSSMVKLLWVQLKIVGCHNSL